MNLHQWCVACLFVIPCNIVTWQLPDRRCAGSGRLRRYSTTVGIHLAHPEIWRPHCVDQTAERSLMGPALCRLAECGWTGRSVRGRVLIPAVFRSRLFHITEMSMSMRFGLQCTIFLPVYRHFAGIIAFTVPIYLNTEQRYGTKSHLKPYLKAVFGCLYVR